MGEKGALSSPGTGVTRQGTEAQHGGQVGHQLPQRSVKQGRAAGGARCAEQAAPDEDSPFCPALLTKRLLRESLHGRVGEGKSVHKSCCFAALPSQFPQQKFALPYWQKRSLRAGGCKRRRKKSISDCSCRAQLRCRTGISGSCCLFRFYKTHCNHTGILHPLFFLHAASFRPTAHRASASKCSL